MGCRNYFLPCYVIARFMLAIQFAVPKKWIARTSRAMTMWVKAVP